MPASEKRIAPATLADIQTEKEFSDAVVAYAKLCGWLIHRDPYWRATGTDPGYPDLTLCREGVVIFAELKVNGKTTPAQRAWLEILPDAAMTASHTHVYLWHPDDWPTIEVVLR